MTVIFGCVIIFFGIYISRLIKLDFFKNHSEIEINELTTQQKVSEITYLIDFINTNFPYTGIVQTEKGLKNVHSVESSLIERVRNSKNDKEYLDIILDYLSILKQGTGHVSLFNVYKKPESNFENGHWYLGLKHKLSAQSFFYQYYWTNLFQELNSNKWCHSNLDIIYDNGYYKMSSDYELNNITIPKGSVIKMVDNIEIDSFVFNHWSDYWLRFDSRLDKSFCCIPDPFVVNKDTTKKEWNLEFETPENKVFQLELPILKGYKNNNPKADFAGNVKCVQLLKDIGYIKIKQFLNYPTYLNDFKIIDSFMSNSGNQFQKLVIDLRGNTGGAPKYWEKLFVERLINQPKHVTLYGAIKKSAWQMIKKDYYLSRPFTYMDIDEGQSDQITLNDVPIEIDEYAFLNDTDWFFYRKTWTYNPKNTFDFKGQLFFLIDNDCFSATENFVIAIKQLELGQIVGANTAGGAMTVCEPWYFELPYSYMILMLELQITFNDNGSINTVYGTDPDIRLDNHQFPTSYPTGFEKNELLQDDWIKYIINEQ